MKKLVSACFDDASMLESQSGFIARLKHKCHNAIGSHCVIHRKALAFTSLPDTVKDKFEVIICLVNFIKGKVANID